MRIELVMCFIPCLLVFSRAAHADGDSIHRKVAFGGKLGVNAVTLGGENGDGAVLESTYKLSLAAGGFVNISLHDFFAVQPEILFMMKGSGREAYDMDRGTHDINYIEIPLLFHGRYPVLPNLDIHGLLGPELSFLVNAEIVNERGETYDLRDELTTVDIGIVWGAGATWYHSQKGAFVVEARYDLGLRRIDSRDGDDVKNRAFSLMIGYQWGRGPRRDRLPIAMQEQE